MADLHEREEFAALTEYLIAASEGALDFLRFEFEHFYILECLANSNGFDEDYPRHQYPNSMLSGVYYVSVPTNCGAIYFLILDHRRVFYIPRLKR